MTQSPSAPQAPPAQTPQAESARDALLALRTELAKAVVGQEGVISGLVIALLCRGHVLLEGVPGVAKTLLVRALSAALQLEFKRVQFTPDLMPGDVTGSLVYDARTAAFVFRPGPVFTNLLLSRLKAGARIINTASDAHHRAKLDFDDLQSKKSYSGFAVYSKSKLCNILFTRELARRIAGTGVTANALHPGFVATRFGDQSGGVLSALVRVAKPIGGISPEEGAKTIIYLASSPEVARTSGEYFVKCASAAPSAEARNDQDARKLWNVSAEIAADVLVKG